MFEVHFWESLLRFLRTNRELAYLDRHFAVEVWAPAWKAARACLNYDRSGDRSTGAENDEILRYMAGSIGYNPDLDTWTDKGGSNLNPVEE